jgi:hypothetical protein
MIATPLPSKQHRGDTTSRMFLRTLILMVELLAAVVTWQHLTTARPAHAHALWPAVDRHTVASVQRCISAPVVTASLSAPAGEGTREP